MTRKALIFASISLIFFAPLFCQEKAEQEDPAKKMAAMMEAWEKISKPGENHKILEDFVGTWDADVKLWMDPSAPPQVTQGRVEFKLLFEGRFLHGHFTGEFMNMPFEGINIMGYDNVKKEFFSIWFDNSSTSLLSSTGTYDPEQKKFQFSATAVNPMTGQPEGVREEAYFASPDEYISVSYTKPMEGEEFKSMEIKYTRVK